MSQPRIHYSAYAALMSLFELLIYYNFVLRGYVFSSGSARLLCLLIRLCRAVQPPRRRPPPRRGLSTISYREFAHKWAHLSDNSSGTGLSPAYLPGLA